MSKKILITRSIMPNATTLLEEAGLTVDTWQKEIPPTSSELLALGIDYDGIIPMVTDQIDQKFLKANSHLKIISNYGVGVNNIDVAAATELGIPIGNTPDVLTDATADLTFALLLGLTRNLLPAYADVRLAKWKKWEPRGYLGPALRGKKLGIFGMGKIGEAVAKRAVAFGLEIIYCSRTPKKELPYTAVSFDQLLKESDFISIHSELNEQTTAAFNFEAIGKMKTTSYLINTSRGNIICEKSLYDALRVGKIAGAGLDVTAPEPMDPNSPLLQMDNVLVTPHIGSATFEARMEMARLAATNIICAFEKRPLIAGVNPQTWEK